MFTSLDLVNLDGMDFAHVGWRCGDNVVTEQVQIFKHGMT